MNRQKSPKFGKNGPKITNFHQKYRNSAKLNKNFAQFSPKNREKCHFLAKFTLFSGKFISKITFLQVFRAKLPKFSKSLLRLGSKIGPNVIRKSKTLLRFAYFPVGKRGFSADAVPLSSALRPRLLKFVKGNRIVPKIQQKSINRTFFHQNHPKSMNSTANFCPKRQKFAVGMVRMMIFVSFVAILGFIGISNIITTNVSALSLNMTIPKSLNLSVNPTVNNGFGESESGEISISTDNISGYTLKVNSKNSSNDLVNPLASNAKLTSITESLTLDEYKNGKGDNKYYNTWAFKPSHINNETNTSFVPGPDSTTGITLAKTEEENSTIPATYAVAIASKVDNTIPAGNYSNTFVLTATANELHYTINYDSASLSGATNAGSFTTQTGVITSNSQQINTIIPTKSDLVFAGWCNQPLEGDGSCKGGVFQAGSYYPMCKCDTDVTLYAMWKEAPSPTTMQDFGNYCDKMSQDQILLLTDTRDDNQYRIAKLKDNRCWMVENLRLGKDTTMELTPADTDTSANYTLPASNASGFKDDSTPNIYVDPIWGGYYDWPAATLGLNTSSHTTRSICPKGWHLPTRNGNDNEVETMATAYGYDFWASDAEEKATATNFLQTPIPGYVLSGYYYYTDSSSKNINVEGSYWTADAYGSDHVYYSRISSTSVMLTYGSSKKNGRAIRCISNQ